MDNSLQAEVVRYWRSAGASQWFGKQPDFDVHFRERFLDLHEAVIRSEHDDWAGAPEGSLALLILLDQFPRHAFRGTRRMYATDALALRFAYKAFAADQMSAVSVELRWFFCLPFAHSEILADQEVSVALSATLGPERLCRAQGHRNIIARFGRFPHRNQILGRESTPHEREFLEAGGFAG